MQRTAICLLRFMRDVWLWFVRTQRVVAQSYISNGSPCLIWRVGMNEYSMIANTSSELVLCRSSWMGRDKCDNARYAIYLGSTSDDNQDNAGSLLAAEAMGTYHHG